MNLACGARATTYYDSCFPSQTGGLGKDASASDPRRKAARGVVRTFLVPREGLVSSRRSISALPLGVGLWRRGHQIVANRRGVKTKRYCRMRQRKRRPQYRGVIIYLYLNYHKLKLKLKLERGPHCHRLLPPPALSIIARAAVRQRRAPRRAENSRSRMARRRRSRRDRISRLRPRAN